MGNQPPGPMCSSKHGPNYVDEGTNCLARTNVPGPVRMLMSMLMGATPPTLKIVPEEKKAIQDGIKIIANSPFGGTKVGAKIVVILQAFDAQNKIIYEDTGDHRGEFYGTGISVSKEFLASSCNTIMELVHEASHKRWRNLHPLKDKQESLDDAVDNELFAQVNELTIYQWLRDEKGICSPNALMDVRLERKAAGTLRSVILQNEKEAREKK